MVETNTKRGRVRERQKEKDTSKKKQESRKNESNNGTIQGFLFIKKLNFFSPLCHSDTYFRCQGVLLEAPSYFEQNW